MFLAEYQSEFKQFLAQAARLLGGPARPVRLDWELELTLRKQITLEARHGLGREPAVLRFDRSKRGHEMEAGTERYRWQTPEGPIRIVRVVIPFCDQSPIDSFWAVAEADYRRFYRRLRAEVRTREVETPPIMAETEQKRLWDNTIGFLRRGQGELLRYGIAPKRGVLMTGEPGNGKTTACRWLAWQCRRHSLEWRNVTPEMFESARADREVPALFTLGSPGIVLFDDFDAAFCDKDYSSDRDKRATFLAELDGVQQKTGIVYLFASNLAPESIDPAMRRPGRIDVVLGFPKPDAALRRRMVCERWHPDLQAAVDIEAAVVQSDGWSFAELEEARKLLVMRHLDTGSWDWPWVRDCLSGAAVTRRSRPIGFLANPNDGHPSPSVCAEIVNA